MEDVAPYLGFGVVESVHSQPAVGIIAKTTALYRLRFSIRQISPRTRRYIRPNQYVTEKPIPGDFYTNLRLPTIKGKHILTGKRARLVESLSARKEREPQILLLQALC